jgi:hypothetical protein
MLFRVLLLAPVFVFSFAFYSAETARAVDVLDDVCRNAEKKNPGQTPAACKDRNPGSNPIYGQEGILTEIINLISILIGIAAVVMIIIGGLKFITSGSNPQDVSTAREIVIYAAIGLIVASLAQVLVRFVLSKL